MTKLKSYVIMFILALVLPQSLMAKEEAKTVSITTSGSGATKDAAQQSALRSAIEQTFGVFISSKTEIFNDQVVADEIASIANGNIQSFKILNASQLPDGNWAVTLNAFISVSKLTSFVQAKGVSVEIQGGLFAMNIKQQLLNEAAEYKATKQLGDVLANPLHNAFDFKIKASEPKSLDGESNNFGVELVVTASANKNMEFCSKYLIKSLSSICLDKSELSNYKALNKKIYELILTEGEFKKDYSRASEYQVFKAQRFYFRKSESLQNIVNVFHFYNKGYNRIEDFYITSFEVNNGINKILGYKMFEGGHVNKIALGQNQGDYDRRTSSEIKQLMRSNDTEEKRNNYSFRKYVYYEYAPIGYLSPIYFNIVGEQASIQGGSQQVLCFPPIGKTTGEFYWREKLKLKELEQLNSFSVKPYVE